VVLVSEVRTLATWRREKLQKREKGEENKRRGSRWTQMKKLEGCLRRFGYAWDVWAGDGGAGYEFAFGV
jgi:hypothetical protein